jgi:hypothetical protein
MSHCSRRQPSHPLWLFLALAIALLAVPGYAMKPGPAPQEPGAAKGDQGGHDFFKTVPKGTFFDFTGDFALPAGFFDEGSPRYSGRVPFKGVPIGKFEGTDTGNADTVVTRRGGPSAGTKYPSRSTAEIELAALSLASAKPISIRVGKATQQWDVKLELSQTRPAAGKMNITQTSAKGGTFSSEFNVRPILTFTRKGDGAQKTLDVGTMKLSKEGERRMTLKANAVPWSTTAPKNAVSANSRFNAGVRVNVPVIINHHNHEIIIATLPSIH